MKKLAVLCVASLLAMPVLLAQEKLAEEFVKHWKTSKEFTLAVAEAMPADGYGFKPNPEEMGFGDLMVHIALSQAGTFARVGETKSPLVKPEKADKAAVLKLLNESFDFCANTGMSSEQLEKMMGRPGGPQSSGREMLWGIFTHTAHHRGQAEVYLRVKGIKPPPYRF